MAGRLDATRLPGAIARHVGVDGPAQPPTSLELRFERGDAWRAQARGSVAGVAIDADLRFAEWPYPARPLPVLLETLRDGVTGYARAERLRIGNVVVEGFEIADDPLPTQQDATTPR